MTAIEERKSLYRNPPAWLNLDAIATPEQLDEIERLIKELTDVAVQVAEANFGPRFMALKAASRGSEISGDDTEVWELVDQVTGLRQVDELANLIGWLLDRENAGPYDHVAVEYAAAVGIPSVIASVDAIIAERDRQFPNGTAKSGYQDEEVAQ